MHKLATRIKGKTNGGVQTVGIGSYTKVDFEQKLLRRLGIGNWDRALLVFVHKNLRRDWELGIRNAD
jgi:hypothetical protein